MSTVVRSRQPDDADVEQLRARAAELDARLRDRDAEVTRVRSALASFRMRYRQEVGLLHDELDELERAIIAELAGFAENDPRRARPAAAAAAKPDSAPRLTSDAVRKLFRDVAKAVHPDLAGDDIMRDHRHRLMVEANEAYALGDEERLRLILESWKQSPEAVPGSGAASMNLRLSRRIAQLEDQLAACDRDLAHLHDSPLWQLKVMVDAAAASGKDLIADMVGRLTRDIMVAQNRLAAIRSRC